MVDQFDVNPESKLFESLFTCQFSKNTTRQLADDADDLNHYVGAK